MFKFLVLCAFVATAVGDPKPDALIPSLYVQPYAAYSTLISPASTSFSSQSSSVIHPSPITYSTPLTYSHFIKKRSAQLLATTYNTPYNYYPYNYPSVPIVAASPYIQSPIAYSGAHLPLAAHLIKKRSAPLLPTSYITPTTYLASPAISTPLIASPYYQTPYYAGAHLPLVNAHFIKKRSAEPTAEPSADPQTFFYPSTSTYLTPSIYTKTIATTPYLSNPFLNTYYSSPAAIPFASAHLIKKRSAEPEAKPSAEPSADPLLIYSSYPSTYYSGSRLIPTYPSTVIKTAPIYAPNPFVYSTFIKK